MQCENYFCIYWKEDICRLQEISLNVQGICQDCIVVNVAEEILQREREAIYMQYEQADALWD